MIRSKRRGRHASVSCRSPERGRRPVVHDKNAPALVVRQLSVAYGEAVAIHGVSFELDAGARLAIVGPNGAGKSSLLRAVAGVHAAAGGTVEIHGHAPGSHICIAYLPQRSEVDWRFPVTVYDVVMMGRVGALGPLRRPRSSDRRLVDEALARVELLDMAQHQIGALSGGQQQRMFIARALAQQAEMVLMDEPLAGLDVHSRNEVLTLLDTLTESTLLVALHDLGIASTHFDHVLLLKRTIVGFGTPAEVFTTKRLQRAYGSCLRMVQTEDGMLVLHDTACSGEIR